MMYIDGEFINTIDYLILTKNRDICFDENKRDIVCMCKKKQISDRIRYIYEYSKCDSSRIRPYLKEYKRHMVGVWGAEFQKLKLKEEVFELVSSSIKYISKSEESRRLVAGDNQNKASDLSSDVLGELIDVFTCGFGLIYNNNTNLVELCDLLVNSFDLNITVRGEKINLVSFLNLVVEEFIINIIENDKVDKYFLEHEIDGSDFYRKAVSDNFMRVRKRNATLSSCMFGGGERE